MGRPPEGSCGRRSHDDAQQNQLAHRYIGISLGGAKSDNTALSVIDHYPQQNKAFVVDVFESLGAGEGSSGDDVLLELIAEVGSGCRVIAFDAPLTLPPCANGCRQGCRGPLTCKNPAVKWMKEQYTRAFQRNKKTKPFTPYSQRPVDLFFRYRFPEQDLFQDETMGANQAPRAVRMQYLKSRIDRALGNQSVKSIEVWPKLSLFHMHRSWGLVEGQVLGYRSLEEGAAIREDVLHCLYEQSHLFIYERDTKKCLTNVAAFDSLIAAWVALQYGLNRCVVPSKDLPLESGWIQIPS